MAHEFESGFFVGQPAWHGLGTVIEEAPSIEEGIKLAGLAWNVVERPIFTEDATGENPIEIGSHKAIVRETDNRPLGVVGKGYRPIQNVDAFNWLDFLLETGQVRLETAGSLREGARIWVLVKFNDEAEVLRGDAVKLYLLLANAHDGTMGFWINFTPTRVVCMNTLNVALANRHYDSISGRALRIKHTASARDAMEDAKAIIDTARGIFDASMDKYRLMVQRPMNDDQFRDYFSRVFYKEGEDERRTRVEAETEGSWDVLSSRNWDTLQRNFEAGIGADIPGVRGTVWAAYNAVTQFCDHQRGEGGENRLAAAWFGSGAALRRRAYHEAESLLRAA